MTFTLLTSNLPTPAAHHLRAALDRILTARGLTLAENLTADYTITVICDSTLQNDRYLITPNAQGATLRAASTCACFAALGKLLHMSSFDGEGGFLPSSSLGATLDSGSGSDSDSGRSCTSVRQRGARSCTL